MKKTSARRAIAWALTLMMLFSAVPFGTLAEEAECGCTSPCSAESPDGSCPVCAAGGAEACAAKGENTQTPAVAADEKNPGNDEKNPGNDEKNPGNGGKDAGAEDEASEGGNTLREGEKSVGEETPETRTITASVTVNGKAYDGTVWGELYQGENLVKDDVTGEAGQIVFTAAPGEYTVKLEILVNNQPVDKSFAVNTADGNASFAWNYQNPTIEVRFAGTGMFAGAQLLYGDAVAQSLSENGTKSVSLKVTADEADGSVAVGVWAKIGDAEGAARNDVPVSIQVSCGASKKQFTIKTSEGYPLRQGAALPGDPWNAYYRVIGDNLQLCEVTAGTYAIESTEAETITVTFDANADGEALQVPEAMTVAKGSTLNIGNESSFGTVERKGYYFLGWSLAPDGELLTPAADLDTTKDFTLYARWAPRTHYEGVEVVPMDDATLDRILGGAKATLNIAGTTPAESDREAVLENVPKDYAKNAKLLDVTLNKVMGSSKEPLTELDGVTVGFAMDVSGLDTTCLRVLRLHGDSVEELPELSAKPAENAAEGFFLDGDTVYIYSGKFSTFAVYAMPQGVHTITFDSNGGNKHPEPMTTDASGKLTQPLPDPGTKEGYTNEAGKIWKNGDDFVTGDMEFSEDTLLVAYWTPISYNVVFKGNGGTLKGSDDTETTISAVYDQKIDPPDFERTDYHLVGWSRKSGSKDIVENFLNLTKKQGDTVTLYACWEYVPKTVTFHAEGGKLLDNKQEVDELTLKTQESPINTVAKLPTPEDRADYLFMGWYTERNGKGDKVTAGKTVFADGDEVYAYWTAFQSVTVHLNAMRGTMKVNGSTVRKTDLSTKWPGVLDGELPTPSCTGYKFTGWYTADGVQVDENTRFVEETTIYAHWTRAVSKTGNPKTGDQVRLGLAVGILAAAAVGLTAVLVVKKRKK